MSDDSIRQQLEATMELLREFLEWRHKVLTRFVVTAGALILAARHLAEVGSPLLVAVPVLGVGFSLAALMMDRANQLVLYHAYRNGVAAEDQLRMWGIFHELEQRFATDVPSCRLEEPWHAALPPGVRTTQDVGRWPWDRFAKYRHVLLVLYGLTFVVSVVAAVLVGAAELSDDEPHITILNTCPHPVYVYVEFDNRVERATVGPGGASAVPAPAKAPKAASVTVEGSAERDLNVADVERGWIVVKSTECR